MGSSEGFLQCYNKGCGVKFSATENTDDSCCHHPGEPVFHDAYKGWSCCKKKCTDFTEFLNIKGCTRSRHSNIKPPEPEKPSKPIDDVTEVIEVKPIVPSVMERPPFDSPMTILVPEIAPSLKQQLLNSSASVIVQKPSGEVVIGTSCKNGGCTASYQGSETDDAVCVHHSGVPIFHEGLKFWSCCQRRTTDFNTFLNQPGCKQGKHLWVKENDNRSVQCRWDYHQTGTHVVVAIYAKQYSVEKSVVQLNPIRLNACLVFPNEDNACFKLDVELKGIVDVSQSHVSMYGTKVEIKLKKAEPGSWSKLEVARIEAPAELKKDQLLDITPKVEAVDLDDL